MSFDLVKNYEKTNSIGLILIVRLTIKNLNITNMNIVSKNDLCKYEVADMKNVNDVKFAIDELLLNAHFANLNYVFIDRDLVNTEIQNELRNLGYAVIVGYGDKARIKISW